MLHGSSAHRVIIAEVPLHVLKDLEYRGYSSSKSL